MPPLFLDQPRFLLAYSSAATIAADPIPTAAPVHTLRPAVLRAADAKSGFGLVSGPVVVASGVSLSGLLIVARTYAQRQSGRKDGINILPFKSRGVFGALRPILAMPVIQPGRATGQRPLW